VKQMMVQAVCARTSRVGSILWQTLQLPRYCIICSKENGTRKLKECRIRSREAAARISASNAVNCAKPGSCVSFKHFDDSGPSFSRAALFASTLRQQYTSPSTPPENGRSRRLWPMAICATWTETALSRWSECKPVPPFTPRTPPDAEARPAEGPSHHLPALVPGTVRAGLYSI
jgi:hypothetical protein